MPRCLVVANQTLGAESLQRAVRERIAAGTTFTLLVPATPPQYEAVAWAVADAGFSLPPPDAADLAEAEAQAERRSRHRLDEMLSVIEAAGGVVEGRIGDPDPYEAVRAVLEDDRFDEILVSTLPGALSRWLRLDLPSRLARLTDIPVTTVEADR
jgi:nucleotide-binding universal stress UspA family protein